MNEAKYICYRCHTTSFSLLSCKSAHILICKGRTRFLSLRDEKRPALVRLQMLSTHHQARQENPLTPYPLYPEAS
jgi:hypothetical protein